MKLLDCLNRIKTRRECAVKYEIGQRVNVESLLPLGVCVVESFSPDVKDTPYLLRALSGDYENLCFWCEKSRMFLAQQKAVIL